jgi:hypothetical protein
MLDQLFMSTGIMQKRLSGKGSSLAYCTVDLNKSLQGR